MDPIEIMKRPAPYASGHENAPAAAQLRAKRLCWEYNRTAPDEAERRGEILRELLGTCDPLTFIEPGVCLACSGHSVHAAQRTVGIGTSAPITLGRDVWIGANATVCGGVTIGEGCVIGAGSVVTKDIPPHSLAVGNPCRVLREITEKDSVQYKPELF